MTEENNKPLDSATSVNSMWLQNVYEQMINLKRGLALARDGMISLEEAMSLPPEEIFTIQMRNFRITLTIFDSLLDDCQPVLDSKFYKDTKGNLKEVRGLFDKTPQLFYDLRFNQRLRTSAKKVNKNFFAVVEKLNESRGKLVMELKGILYLHKKNKGDVVL